MAHRHKFITRPLFQQVRDELASRIAAGVWRPGALLPNEVQLAQDCGVSQGTMRKALNLLEAERIVVRQVGRGTMVVDHDTNEMAIRFSSIYNTLDQRISGHITACDAAFSMPTEEEVEAFKIPPTQAVARATRVRVNQDEPFMVEQVTVSPIHFKEFDLDEFRNARLTAIAQRYGVILNFAIERLYPILCPPEHQAALCIEEPTPILALRRITFNDRNEAAELRIGWCHLKDKYYQTLTS